MRIITISRQFGSGGRELGKRLADYLGWDYYDKEIINRLAEEEQLDTGYVNWALSDHHWSSLPLSFHNTFSGGSYQPEMPSGLLRRQSEIIESIAKKGENCIIVGRDADLILREYNPFRVFVCGDMEARLERCMKHERKKEEAERLSEKEVRRNIKRIDKERANVREILTGGTWGEGTDFQLTVNTTGWDIKALVPAVAQFAEAWYEQ